MRTFCCISFGTQFSVKNDLLGVNERDRISFVVDAYGSWSIAPNPLNPINPRPKEWTLLDGTLLCLTAFGFRLISPVNDSRTSGHFLIGIRRFREANTTTVISRKRVSVSLCVIPCRFRVNPINGMRLRSAQRFCDLFFRSLWHHQLPARNFLPNLDLMRIKRELWLLCARRRYICDQVNFV